MPIGLAMLHISNPKLQVTDVLGRLSHDSNEDVAQAATLCLGIVGAGTNNARFATQLRQLSSYYYKDPSLIFLVRIAQGLVHLEKGLLTLSPSHSTGRCTQRCTRWPRDQCVLHAGHEADHPRKYHFMLYYLFVAAQPRMLMTVDEEGKPVPVSVRVGQAVDVVGQAGSPRLLLGWPSTRAPCCWRRAIGPSWRRRSTSR